MSANILKDSPNNNKRYQKEKNKKEYNISIIKKRFNKKKANLASKVKNKKKENSKNKQKNEEGHTFRNNNQILFFDKIQNHFNKIIKREKSADHLKKNPSLNKKIQNFFNEIGYYDTNYILNNINKNSKKSSNKQLKNKNFTTLILFKKNKGELLIEKKRKSYFSPEKLDQQKKNKFYKRLLNLRTVSGAKLNPNLDILLFNHKENLNINNYETNYNSLFKSVNGLETKNINNKKNSNNNNKIKNEKKNIKQKKNILYKSHNLLYKIGLTPQKNSAKNKNGNNSNINYNNNPLTKSTNIPSVQVITKKSDFTEKSINNKIIDEQPSSLDKNLKKNKYNNDDNNINNYGKINVKKIDSMSNYNTNNSINIKTVLEIKNMKNEEICFTDENQIPKKKYEYSNELLALNKDDNFSFRGNENRNINFNTNNIRVCKVGEIRRNENKKLLKDFNRNKSCKKSYGIRETLRDSTSVKKFRSKNANKTPNKESLFNLKNFQNLLITNIKSNFFGNNNNSNNNDNGNNAGQSETLLYYNILYGNNGKLVEKVLKTRENWEKIDSQNSKNANLIWTPLSCQINYSLHSSFENTQFVNHFEFHRELTNKASTFINLFRYCEFNDIDLFSFYPLTIILSSNLDYLQTQIEGFKRCYEDIPNLLYDNNNVINNSNNINTEENNENNFYINYFYVNLSKKIGTRQRIKIPKTFYIGKNLWLLKRTNLNRGREMKVLSNLDDIIKEINFMFEGKKQKPNNLIIQKYLESPLLYNGRKFDIRIWVLFLYSMKENNYTVYVFKEGHLKACSDEFNIDNDNLFIHLTNYSVQKHNKNFSKSEIGNEISFQMFQDELNKKNINKNFKKDIFPEIVKIIWITAKAGKNKINIMDRKNCFEIYGYDFILDTNFNPFLLEINTNPGLEESSPLIKMLVPRMIDDAFRLTIDKMYDNKSCAKSKFSVEGYTDEENMWQKIKKI